MLEYAPWNITKRESLHSFKSKAKSHFLYSF